MGKNPPRIVIDTNVLISSIIFGGNPKKIIELVLENKIIAITSQILLSELFDILVKKFHFTPDKILLVEEVIKENFVTIYPNKTISVVRDKDDNRVLEAATAGNCQYIVTGDKDLLDLGSFQGIIIVNPNTFLTNLTA